jgi:hypothetical protein
MDTQSLMPGSSGPFSTTPTGGGRSSMLVALVVILGLGTLIFGILTVTYSNKATTLQNSTNQQKAAAADAARTAQKRADDIEYTKINESPYRAYIAPVGFGSFVINFPKNWSSYVREQPSGTQVSLALNPNFIRNTNGEDEITAVRVILLTTAQDSYMAQYASAIKTGKLKKTITQISGQTAYDLTGTFNGKKTIREVVVPIRDKVLVFSSEASEYSSEFGAILSQAKIIP